MHCHHHHSIPRHYRPLNRSPIRCPRNVHALKSVVSRGNRVVCDWLPLGRTVEADVTGLVVDVVVRVLRVVKVVNMVSVIRVVWVVNLVKVMRVVSLVEVMKVIRVVEVI